MIILADVEPIKNYDYPIENKEKKKVCNCAKSMCLRLHCFCF